MVWANGCLVVDHTQAVGAVGTFCNIGSAKDLSHPLAVA